MIPEKHETSVEIFSRVLRNFLVPENDIERFIETIRADNYELFLNRKVLPKTFIHAEFTDFRITCIRVQNDSGKLIGKPLKELKLRSSYQINILGISRNNKMIDFIQPNEML